MKEISIQDLKARLSAVVAEAEAGRTILVTRHRERVAQLGPVRTDRVHRGRAVGTTRLQPAITRGTKGRYLVILREDRSGR